MLGWLGPTTSRCATSRSWPVCTGHNDRNDHAVYFSYAVGGPHDILIDGLTVDGTGPAPLSSALHFYHSDSTNKNAWNTTIRNLVVNGTYQAVILWDSTLRNITIDGATITNARYNAVRYENPGSGIVLKDMTRAGQASAASPARWVPTRPASRSSTPASTHSRPARAASG